jgi:predicted dehydrogenase
MELTTLTRRSLLAGAAAYAGSAIVPGRTAASAKGPNDRIAVACIGLGSQGTYRLNELLKQEDVRVAALCDVDRRHLDRAAGIVEKAKGYRPAGLSDFRRLLELKEIDAVVVATPDHWHAIPTLAAFEAGKDVFVEKPLSYSVAEGRAMADASLNYQRVTQMGNHIHNDYPNYRRVVEIVKSGKLGRITHVHAWKTSSGRGSRRTQPERTSCPPELNYDFWLGPAPKRTYDPLRCHGSFRQFWDYSGGTFIDFWCHISDVAFWAMDLQAPRFVSSVGARLFSSDGTECPDTQEAILEFPDMFYTFSLRPWPLTGFEHIGQIGCVFQGASASLVTNYQKYEVWAKGKRVDDYPLPPRSIPDSPGHMREFLDAVKSRNLDTTCNVRYGHALSKCGLLANIAYRTGRRLAWDDANERIVGDKGADQYLRRRYRGPWKVKVQRRPAAAQGSRTA